METTKHLVETTSFQFSNRRQKASIEVSFTRAEKIVENEKRKVDQV